MLPASRNGYSFALGCVLTLSFFLIKQPLLAQQPPPKVSLRVLSWNIQMLPRFGSTFSPALRKMQKERSAWIADYLNQEEFDIICLQEVFDKGIRRRMRKALKEKFHYEVKPRNTILSWKQSTGVWFISRVPIKELGTVFFKNGRGSDALANKGCTLVEYSDGSSSVQLAGTHLQSGSGAKEQAIREQQYNMIDLDLLDRYRGNGVVQVLLGDLNTEREIPERFSRMLNFTGMQYIPYYSENRTFTADERNSWLGGNVDGGGTEIDYILLKANNSSVRLHSMGIIRPTHNYKGKEIDLADHYGVKGWLMLEQ